VPLGDLPVQLARELVARGAQVVVVGGSARRLLGAARPPRDLDVVVAERDVDGLAALGDLLER
jgi:NAD(P)-dependent dehydrogenase (short-subunit alcohol dehydrogenase family)